MNCPKCNASTERRENQFYFRGHYYPGMVCVKCNALYETDDQPFLAAAANLETAHIVDPILRKGP